MLALLLLRNLTLASLANQLTSLQGFNVDVADALPAAHHHICMPFYTVHSVLYII